MATKEHVVKVVNGATERAVMVSPTTPGVPIDTQIWFDNVKKQLAIFSAGVITPLNCRVLAGDPPAPIDNESWINATSNQLKYRYLGATYTINLGAAPSGGSGQSAGNYYAVLTQDELSQLSNIGLLYPNYLIDAFNNVQSNAVYTNAHPAGSALRLIDGQNSGKVDYNQETSTVLTSMEGIVVYTPRDMVPTSIVNNNDGTSTIIVSGDMTPYIATGKIMMFYKEITANATMASVYVTGNDSFPLEAPIVTVGPAPASNSYAAPVYASGPNNTTFTVKTSSSSASGIDIMGQLGSPALSTVRLFANDLTVKVGGNGTAGTMDTAKLVDAHGLDALRTLGGDVFKLVTSDLSSNINKITVKQSPNRQYTLIQAVHTLAGDFMEYVYYYSNDSLATLNRMTQTYPLALGIYNTVPYDNFNSEVGLLAWDRLIQINDSGKFVLSHYVWNDNNYQRGRLAYGNLNDATPILTFPPSFGGGPGIPLATNVNQHYEVQSLAIDSADNYLVCTIVNQSNHVLRHVWYSNQGATFLGTSGEYEYDVNFTHSRMGWYMLQGELQAVWIGESANTGYPRWERKKISEILAATPYVGNDAAFQMKPFFGNYTNQFPFSSTEGTCYLVNCSLDLDKIRFTYFSSSNARSIYGEVDMLAPIAGNDDIQHIAFDAIPASGQWQLTFPTHGTTSPAFGFSATAIQIQNGLEALGGVGVGQVAVTGNYATGFNVHWEGTLGLSTQPLLVVFSNTLADIGSVPVNITITDATPGVLPIYPTFNSAGFRHLGTGDKVMLFQEGNNPDYSYWGGGYSDAQAQQFQYSDRTFLKHPTDSNRGWMAWERFNTRIAPNVIDGMVLQIDHLNTFQGLFDDKNSVATSGDISTVAGVNNGDKLARLITWDRAITVRTIAAGEINFTWNSFPFTGPRDANVSVRAKLVGVGGGGIPNEGTLIELSPTKHNLYDIWQPRNYDLHFRFNQPVTNGLQHYLVIYLENLTPSINWTATTGIPRFIWRGASATNNAYYQGGIWTVGTVDYSYRAYDYFVEPVKTADTFQYPLFDLSEAGVNSGTYAFGQISEFQIGFNTPKTEIMASWTFGQDFKEIGSNAYVNNRTIAYRRFNIPASNTFASDLNSPTPTLYLGYDAATYDHNLMMQVRLSDPVYPLVSRFGTLRYASTDHNFPLRGIDVAGGAWISWQSANLFATNNLNFGHTQDSRFKSGWATHFGLQGYVSYGSGAAFNFRAENFIIEVEIVPTATDITGYSGGLSVIAAHGNGNQWYFGLQDGNPCFVIQNNIGPGFATSATTKASAVLLANTYYRLRVTKADDNFIHLFRWRNATEGWIELPYASQTNTQGKALYPVINEYIYLGRYGASANYYWDGRIGEYKMSIGTNTFLNGDAIYDQRPMIGHHNIGDRVIAKHVIDGGVSTDGTADDARIWETEGVMLAQGATSGLRAGFDQLFTYRDVNLPQGKKMAAELQLDRVSGSDGPAVQGFLFNYMNGTSINGGGAVVPSLGMAAAFEILAGSTVTNTGFSAVVGDLGVSPGTSIVGFPPGTVTGAQHAGDATAASAQSDLTVAYNGLVARPFNVDLTGQDLGGMTLTPGVYKFSSSAAMTGTLTLDAQGNSAAVWVFQIGSTLVTATSAAVNIINGGIPANVFFQVGSSATLGTGTAFKGNILANVSITMNTGASITGRALARSGAVTMDDNAATLP